MKKVVLCFCFSVLWHLWTCISHTQVLGYALQLPGQILLISPVIIYNQTSMRNLTLLKSKVLFFNVLFLFHPELRSQGWQSTMQWGGRYLRNLSGWFQRAHCPSLSGKNLKNEVKKKVKVTEREADLALSGCIINRCGVMCCQWCQSVRTQPEVHSVSLQVLIVQFLYLHFYVCNTTKCIM